MARTGEINELYSATPPSELGWIPSYKSEGFTVSFVMNGGVQRLTKDRFEYARASAYARHRSTGRSELIDGRPVMNSVRPRFRVLRFEMYSGTEILLETAQSLVPRNTIQKLGEALIW